MRLLAETQMGEIKELKSQLLTLKKELETQCQMKDEKNKLLEAELGEARSEAAKISQQQAKSGQAQRCAGCPKLQERITSLEMEARFFEGLKKQLDSYMKAKEHPPGSSTTTTVSG
jgi:chromosome segregation ATPase